MYLWLKPAFERFTRARAGHAWLIYGTEGLGKSEFALALAKYKLCHHTSLQPEQVAVQACGHCQACLLCDAKNHSDLYVLETEKAAIGVDEIRDFTQYFQLSSQLGASKVGIIQDAHKLNHAAANALLKMLEEPPGNTCFFLVTSHPWRLLATIRSRCQRLFIQTPKPDALLEWAQIQVPTAQLSLEQVILMQNNPKKLLHSLKEGEHAADALDFSAALACHPVLPECSTEQLLDWVSELQQRLIYLLKARIHSENMDNLDVIGEQLKSHSTVQIQQLYQNLTDLKRTENEGLPPNFRVRLFACLSEFTAVARDV